MKLDLHHGNILDLRVDVLVCSANVSLNLSGGVGGALLCRYGSQLQEELHGHLPSEPPRFVKRGDVIVTRPTSTPYKAVLHAVAVDAFYDSSPEVITDVCGSAFRTASQEQAQSLALTALATGFGHLTIAEFAEGLRPVLTENFPPLQRVIVAVQSDLGFDDLKQAFSDDQTV